MKTIELSKEIKVGDVTTKALTLDFEKLNGRNMITAEKRARLLGDQTPAVVYSMTYQAIVAAMASGIALDDIMDLPGQDLLNVLEAVNSFLFNRG